MASKWCTWQSSQTMTLLYIQIETTTSLRFELVYHWHNEKNKWKMCSSTKTVGDECTSMYTILSGILFRFGPSFGFNALAFSVVICQRVSSVVQGNNTSAIWLSSHCLFQKLISFNQLSLSRFYAHKIFTILLAFIYYCMLYAQPKFYLCIWQRWI